MTNLKEKWMKLFIQKNIKTLNQKKDLINLKKNRIKIRFNLID